MEERTNKKRKREGTDRESSANNLPKYDLIKTNVRKYEDKCGLYLIDVKLMDEFASLTERLTSKKFVDYYEKETLRSDEAFRKKMNAKEPFASYLKRRQRLVEESKQRDEGLKDSSESYEEDVESLDTYADYWFVLFHHWKDTLSIVPLHFYTDTVYDINMTLRNCADYSFIY